MSLPLAPYPYLPPVGNVTISNQLPVGVSSKILKFTLEDASQSVWGAFPNAAYYGDVNTVQLLLRPVIDVNGFPDPRDSIAQGELQIYQYVGG